MSYDENTTILERLKILRGKRSFEEMDAFFREQNPFISWESIEEWPFLMGLNTLHLIAQKTGVDLNWLITGKGEFPKPE